MNDIKTLLELRNKLKQRKPDFIRQDYQRRKRLGRKLKWRKPKGVHSKIRHHFKGRRKMPSPGYRSPREARSLDSSGLKMIKVARVDDLKKISKESEGAVISKNVGMKKKLEVLKKAKELNVAVLNLNADEQIKRVEDLINSKKKPTLKEDKKEEVKKEIDTKEPTQKASVSSEEIDKESEKREKDKILTKRI